MGIRFYCPNGHRLNVKDFLAGKRGICPHCEAHFRIPPESQIPKGSPKIRPGSAAEMGLSNGKRRSKTATTAAVQDSPTAIATKPEPESKSRLADPIDEAPDAVWYVRPPSGGQYGPAKGEVMRRWVAEGRVSADSLVWREGWPDWQLAGPVFPSLSTGYVAPSLGKREPVALNLLSTNESSTASLPVTRKAKAKKKSLAAVVILASLIVGLLVVLVIVLMNRQ